MTKRPPQSLAEGLFRCIEIDDDGAWWAGALTQSGYPVFRNKRAHRLLYELLIGPIPPDMDIDHECHNEDESCVDGPACRHRRCMVPAHWVLRSRGDNVRRGHGAKATKKRRAAVTRCHLGHRLELLPGGRRGCRTCRRKRGRVAVRNAYRVKVGIPLDAPVTRAGSTEGSGQRDGRR